jgi:hypothetical protein
MASKTVLCFAGKNKKQRRDRKNYLFSYCNQRLHFETAMDQASLSFSCQYPTQFGSPSNAPSSPKESNIKLTPVPYFSQHDLQVFPQQPRQKGRPRKRKPKDIEAMTANLGKYNFNVVFVEKMS